jgi:hypothetical protein
VKHTVLLVALTLSPTLARGGPIVKCTDLSAVAFGSEVAIESARMVTATATTPEHCDVRGTIWPEAKFAVKLPTVWNYRFYMAGNGGLAGTISLGPMDSGLRKGFATASTNTGHDAEKEPLASFAWPGPNNPNAKRKVIDFAYQAVHETAVLAKKIIKTYYGEAPRFSYWVGCSQGGRQGLMEAQRFPKDFHGLVVGAPVLNLAGTLMRHVWNAQTAQAGPGAIAVDKLPLLAKAVYAKCDGIDGLEDGLIGDPRQCKFDPAADLPKCPADADNPNCFTTAQVKSLGRMYDGVRTSAGELLFPGQPFGAEAWSQTGPAGGTPRSGWDGNIVGNSSGFSLAESYMRFMALDPPAGPAWDYRTFNFDSDPARMAGFAAQFNTTDPDLQPFKRRGGKIIHYHGWADPMVTALMSVDYYESVLKRIGDKGTKEFYRLFLIPGMFHCGGGVGCDAVDWVAPIVDWVERGAAPGRLMGSRVEGSETKRTRPVCPYPEAAKYKGTGSLDAAENFTCVALEQRSR